MLQRARERFRRDESANEEENEEGKSRGAGEKHEASTEEREKRKKKKNRKSVGKRNYWLMRRSFHHVASERESAIDRCFTTKVTRVFASPLFFFFLLVYFFIFFRSSKRPSAHVSFSKHVYMAFRSMIHRSIGPLYRIAPKTPAYR